MKRLVYILTAVLALASCAKEEFTHPSEAQAPKTAAAYEPIISIDQEINQVTFSVDAQSVIPVWLFQDKDGEFTERRAQNGFKRIFATAGDYKVRMQIMNASGITPDYVEKTFHINNTIASFDRYITFLAGGTSADNAKNWHIDGDTAGHMGCGPAGTIGLEWWNAAPKDKEAFGVYEDIVTFGGAGAYTYDPGDDGSVYVNKDIAASPFAEQKGDATEDYLATVEAQTSSYAFEFRGNDLYLVLPEHTLFPYIDNDSFWAKPEFQVINISREELELVHDNGDIAWHFILTSKAAAYVFKGYKYNADSNLWKPADDAHTYSYYYAPDWSQIDNPETEQSGAEYTLSLPAATSSQWQAQFFIIPDSPIVLSADKNYDYSVIVNTNKDLPGMTFKLTAVDSDDVFLFANRVAIPAGETIYYLSDLKGVDAPNGVKMAFDFGGNAEGTVVSVGNIVLKDHAVDDGTILPSEEPEGPDTPASYTYGENLLGGSYLKETWFSAADWSGGLDPQASFEGGVLTLTVPDGIGGGEWQGQVKIVADIPADPEKQYAFFATIESSAGGMSTVKLADANDDTNHAFFYDNAVALEDYAPLAYKNEPVSPDQAYEAVMVIFDFGRIPAGAEVKVSGIELREITGQTGGGVSYGDELLGDIFLKETWFSPADWSGGLDPAANFEGGVLSLTVPDGVGGSEWQGQVKLVANVPVDPEKQYAFAATLESSAGGVCTIKVADANDDTNHAFFYDNAVALEAYAPFTYKNEPIAPDQAYEAVMVIFDFGRIPAGTEITVKGISLKEVTTSQGGGSVSGYGDSIIGDSYLKETWFSPADWSGGLDPAAKFEGGVLTLTVPEGVGGNEWQGQVKIVADVPADPAVAYQFTCKLESSAGGVCTIKLADANDDANHFFFYDNAVALEAYDVLTYVNEPVSPDQAYDAVMVIFDFGRLPAGTEITVKDIALCPAK